MTSKAQFTEVKIDKFDFICSMKILVKKMKRYVIDWEKIFAQYICNKKLVSKLCK